MAIVTIANSATDVQAALRQLADPARAKISAGFFKCGPGEYGAGDRFRGIRVPDQRRIARQFRDLNLVECQRLLRSAFHEDRLTALEILVAQFARADPVAAGRIYRFYLNNTRWVNNWDLVDCSARKIVGVYLRERSRRPAYRLARSPNLWERRIAMVSTQAWMGDGDLTDVFGIARLLLDDDEDLIHKAVGWMLREADARSRPAVRKFLQAHYERLPRTALRYAIEHFPPLERRRILQGQF